jgi:hypothetical protein
LKNITRKRPYWGFLPEWITLSRAFVYQGCETLKAFMVEENFRKNSNQGNVAAGFEPTTSRMVGETARL